MTIVAPATAPGGALSIVRLSGPDAIRIADTLWHSKRPLQNTESRRAVHGLLVDTDNQPIDDCLATIWRAPNSYTGEDSVELSLHGSPWITRTVIDALIKAGARPAEGGEFTQRAFLNGRLDLTEAEGVADLIAASSRAAHRLAISQTRGHYSKTFAELRDRLIHFASMLELELDFAEEDVEFADRNQLISLASKIRDTVSGLADSYATGRVLKEGVPVVIAGSPNAGKSTLLNLLLGDDKAIVSPIAGTTRDTIEDTIELDGILYRFIDTAGLREETDDPIELQGIDRTRQSAAKATIILWLHDPTAPAAPQQALLHTLSQTLRSDQTLIHLTTKSDLQHQETSLKEGTLNISAKTAQGVPDLRQALKTAVLKNSNPAEDLIITNARHHAALRQASQSLTRSIDAIKTDLPADLIAQDLREAILHLSLLTGVVTSDDTLQNIFSHFCIGK